MTKRPGTIIKRAWTAQTCEQVAVYHTPSTAMPSHSDLITIMQQRNNCELIADMLQFKKEEM